MGDPRPGYNGGGSLKTGNTVGVGRKRSEVREAAVNGSSDFVDWLQKVVRGNKVWPTIDKEGSATNRYPSGDEMLEAGEKLLKYGLGTKVEMSGEDGGPISLATSPDLSRLTVAEREQMLALAEKAEAAAQDTTP